MFKMPTFDMNTRPETSLCPKPRQNFVRCCMLQLIDVMKLISVANVSVHTSMSKEDILAFNMIQEYTKYYVYLAI